MGSAHQNTNSTGGNRLGGLLIGFAIVAVVVAYPPPATGLAPFLGVGGMFLPLIVSVVALLIAIGGGVFLARGIVSTQSQQSERLLIRLLVPVAAVVVISAYLVFVAGFAPLSSFIIAAVVLALLAGTADEFVNSRA